GLSASDIAAQQAIVDSAVRGIDSAASSQFDGHRLLDGSSGFVTAGVDNTKIKNLTVVDRQTTAAVTVNVNVTAQATQAANTYTGGALGSAATVTVTGPEGTTSIALASGSSTTTMTAAFNAATYLTGVTAVRNNANQITFGTVDYG